LGEKLAECSPNADVSVSASGVGAGVGAASVNLKLLSRGREMENILRSMEEGFAAWKYLKTKMATKGQ
jgi:hypothetical protein